MPPPEGEQGSGSRKGKILQIAILLFDDITILDAVGPYEVLSRIPGAVVTWVASSPGLKKAKGGLTLLAERRLDEVPNPRSCSSPGGPASRLS